MSYEELADWKIQELERKIRNNESVSRWSVYPHRTELRRLLKDDEEASQYLELLIESAEDSM